jgi:hypothetical protein
MAHVHYVLDLYFPEGSKPDQFRREVLRIEAANDGEAVAEGVRVNGWRRPSFYRVRAIKTSARSGDVVLFETQPTAAESVEAEQQ